jgi:hypothetical protein
MKEDSARNLPEVDYFVLAKQAQEARKANLKTNDVKDLRKAVKLYKRAADEAFKQGDESTARLLRSRAHNLKDILRHVFEDFNPL